MLPSAANNIKNKTMMTIEQAEQQIIEEFELFDDWMDKYNYIIELGKELPLIDAQYKTPEHLIAGCQSQVWLHAEYKDGRIFFTADSDAIITKGIINLLIKVLSGRTPQEIIDAQLDYIDAIGLKEHLSPTRSNGLLSMIKQIKMYAIAFHAKEE
jgi:cysteine desulfuration protein SufE